MRLKKIPQEHVIISKKEAQQVLKFFFGRSYEIPSENEITMDDRMFAQLLMHEAIRMSEGVSWVESLFRASSNPTSTIKAFLRRLAISKIKNKYFKNIGSKDIEETRIYEAVRNQLTRSFRTMWHLRMTTGELSY